MPRNAKPIADSLLSNNSVSQYAHITQRHYQQTETEKEKSALFATILEEKLQDFAVSTPQQAQIFASRASGLDPTHR